MFNILISGFTGKAGSMALKYLRAIGFTYTYSYVLGSLLDTVVTNVVVIDFSSPLNLNTLLRAIVLLGCKLIVGTTGYSTYQTTLLVKFADLVPIFVSSNFNRVFLSFLKIIQCIKTLQLNMECVLVETHCRSKLDLPSGSTYLIASAIALDRVFSLRYGSEIGTHCLKFVDADNELVLMHRCLSRIGFLNMLPYVVKFVLAKSCGLYSFRV